MKYSSEVGTGALAAVSVADSSLSLKGVRIIPILASTATFADVAAAYAGCLVSWNRSSEQRSSAKNPDTGLPSASVTDIVPVVGPDWIRSPGFGGLQFKGVAGVTYFVLYAEDCKEIEDVATPCLYGFGAGAPASAAKTASYTAAQSSTANIPSVAGDGVSVAGCNGVVAHLSAGAGQTVTAAGLLVWWRYNASTGRWSEGPIQEVTPISRRDVCGADQLVGPGVDRVFVEWRSGTLSAAGSATLTLVAN